MPTSGLRFPFTLQLLLLLITTTFLSLNNNVFGVPDTTLKDASCSQETWDNGGSYGWLVQGLVNSLIRYTPLALDPRYVCTLSNTDGTDTVYGSASCNTQLLASDCTTCLTAAQQTAYSMCPYAVGASIELVDCTMRYENYAI